MLQTKTDIDIAIEMFTNTITNAFTESTYYTLPYQTINQNKDLEILLSRKRALRRRWQRYRFPTDKTNLNKLQKEIKTLLQQIRQDAFDEQILFCQSNHKELWKISRALTGKRTTVVNHALKEPNGKTFYKDQDKANLIASTLKSRFQTQKT